MATMNRRKMISICAFSAVGLWLTLGGSVAANAAEAVQVPVRALHFVLRDVPLQAAYRLVDNAAAAGFNTVMVTLTDGVALDHAPWTPSKKAWTKKQLTQWAEYARKKHMAVVPEVKLLSHQEKFFQKQHPELMYNAVTYDPDKPGLYNQYVFPIIDEILATISPAAVNIGHDEIAGFNEASKSLLKKGEKMLPSDRFLSDVIRLHEYLNSKHVETWMWGDMLIAPGEFPSMNPRTLHGGEPGYGRSLREQLPRDIVICDWHYADAQADFPSLAMFKADGFRVLGATWKDSKTIHNFSSYAKKNEARGMIATTWYYVQRRQWDIINQIISVSGSKFLKDFPDAK